MKQLIPALLAALCLLLASCGTSQVATLPMGTDETPVESEAPESTGPWAPTGEQMQKENAVTDLLNESGEGYSYRIPQLNCQTQDAELINTAISDELMPLVDEAHTAQAQGYDPTCVEIGWESHWCGDVLVLLTHTSYPNDCAYHQVYCFDRITRHASDERADPRPVRRDAGGIRGGAPMPPSAASAPSIRITWATTPSGRSSSNGRAAPKMSMPI